MSWILIKTSYYLSLFSCQLSSATWVIYARIKFDLTKVGTVVGKQAQKSKVNARRQLKWWSIGFKQGRRKCQGRRDSKSDKKTDTDMEWRILEGELSYRLGCHGEWAGKRRHDIIDQYMGLARHGSLDL